MKLNRAILSSCCLVSVLLGSTASKSPEYKTYQYNYENVLGTSFELKVNASSEESADQAEKVALDEVDRLNAILSTYQPASEISRWMRSNGTDEKISPELFEVLSLFDQWKEKTNGALSASVAVASGLWKNSAANQLLPSHQQLTEATKAMHEQQWQLNELTHTARHISPQPLAFNSFVKSYIIRKVSDSVMSVTGVHGCLVNIGGDLVRAGNNQSTIQVMNPTAHADNGQPIAILNLNNKAIATSGNYHRGFQIGDQWFSHIIDVRTALPVTDIISATVVAKDATTAGALATAFNILTPEESAELAKTIPDAAYQLITKKGEQIVSPGWVNLLSADTEKATSVSKPQQEVAIEIELARFEGRSHRPFVAVWVENNKKESVRNLAIWYNKPRWLPDLKRWYSKNQTMTQDYTTMNSVSSATRSAGKYTLLWDGLDDAGKTVKSGKYTIYIEAAREHGTYQLLKQEIEWNGKPAHFDLESGVEITSSSIDIRTKEGN